MSKTSVSKAVKLLEWIKKNTDKQHPDTQYALRKIAGEKLSKEIMGDKGTYARRINELANALNTDALGNLLSKEEWRIVYPGFQRKDSCLESTVTKNGKIYYSQPVSDAEMDFLISSIRNTYNFTEEEKASLEKRLKGALCSKYYEYPGDSATGLVEDLCLKKVNDSDEVIRNNISTIRDYVRNRIMVEIKLAEENDMNRDDRIIISVYRIVFSEGYFWLIANRHERPPETYIFPDYFPEDKRYDRFFPWYTDELTAYRIDKIERIFPVYVDEETFIHKYINKYGYYLDQSYVRTRKYMRKEVYKKARYTPEIKQNLIQFEKKRNDITLVHGQDLKMN